MRPVTGPLHGARFVTANLIHVSAGVPFVSFTVLTTETDDVNELCGLKNSRRKLAYAVVLVIRSELGVIM